MGAEIDWAKLAAELGLNAPYGEYCCGSDDALRALEQIIGEDTLRASVDYYVECRLGSALARSVLWRLQPWSAMCRCYEIFKGPETVASRRTAVELLRVLADRRTLPWISEFLQDDDAQIQVWGAGVLDQLLWSELIGPEEAEELLRAAEQHSNESVQERAKFIRSFLLSRAEAARMREDKDSCCGE